MRGMMRLALLGVPGAQGGDPELAALLAKFEGTVGQIAIADHDSHLFFLCPSDDQWFGAVFRKATLAENAKPDGLSPSYLMIHQTGIDQESAARSGTWTLSNSVVGFQRSFRSTTEAGATMTFTTPANITEIGFLCPLSTGHASGGIATVSIDGDLTAAIGLPTAQDLFDAGKISEAARDNLGATTRCFDQYDPPARAYYLPFGPFLLASGLSSSVHTVVFTNTAEKNVGSAGNRFYISGIYHPASVLGPKSIFFRTNTTLVADGSRVEFAFNFTPDGATNPEWVGHDNSEYTTSYSINLDGESITPGVSGDVISGTTAQLLLNTYHRHSETGAVDIAECARTLTFSALDGIRIAYTFKWLVDGVYNSGYTAMLPVPDLFNRGSNVGRSSDYDLTDDDDSIKANAEAAAAYVWQVAGNWGALLYLSDLNTVLNWRNHAAASLWIQDRVGGVLNKIYASYTPDSNNVRANDVWSADYYIRLKYFSDGAEAALARV